MSEGSWQGFLHLTLFFGDPCEMGIEPEFGGSDHSTDSCSGQGFPFQ